MKNSLLNKISNIQINSTQTTLSALKQMDSQCVKLLFVFEKDKFISLLSLGDIQRAIIKGITLIRPERLL